jgi:hypothetical protein
MDFRDRMNKTKARLGSVSPMARAKLPPAVRKILEETAMLIRIAESAAAVGHQVWCDSVPRGTWVPCDCNCELSDVYQDVKAFMLSDVKEEAHGH